MNREEATKVALGSLTDETAEGLYDDLRRMTEDQDVGMVELRVT